MAEMGNNSVGRRMEQLAGVNLGLTYEPDLPKTGLLVAGGIFAVVLAAVGIYLYAREPKIDWTPPTTKKPLPNGFWIHGSSCQHDPCKWISVRR